MVSSKAIGDYVSLQRGTTYKGKLVGKPGPALLGLGSIYPGGGFRADYKTYGGECPEKLVLHPGDLFVSLKGATKDSEMIGSVARVPLSVPSGRLTQDTVKLIFHAPDHNVGAYLYWLLRTPQYRKYCAAHATGSAVVALSREDFLSYPVPLFSAVRERIIRLLENIESKIELNRRMNETLEAIAQAIFKSWFVDFDPVRAKAEGRRPAQMDAETATLFPDSFQDSPLGEIPSGWVTGRLDDVIDLARESLNPSEHPDEVFDHYSIPAFDDGRLPKLETGEQIKSSKFMVHAEAVLLSRLNPRFPRTWLPVVDARRRSICSTEFFVAMPKPGTTREYVYGLFVSDSFREVLATLVTGTSSSHQRVRPEDILKVEVTLPSSACLRRFSEIAKILHAQSASNLQQGLTLSAIRDTLLPKLISGEIRAKEAHPLAEPVL